MFKTWGSLLSEATKDCLNASDLFNDFFVVSYQSGRCKVVFYFVPKKMAKDAGKSFELLFEIKCRILCIPDSVKDEGQFLELAPKTSAGCTEKADIGAEMLPGKSWKKYLPVVIPC